MNNRNNLSQSLEKHTIHRIVIGDVGSGKTVIAFITALSYLHSIGRGQVCLLAPTEVLAFQHYQKLLEYQKKWKHSFFDSLLTVFVSGKQVFINNVKATRNALKKQLATQEYRCVFWVGTQAILFQEDMQVDLVLVDEQHRFGVQQRQKLIQQARSDGGFSPHFLSFSATPIPRTLALTVYKHLQPIFVDSLASRAPIKTNVLPFDEIEAQVLPMVSQELSKGRKVYVVCAKVEDPEDSDDTVWSIKRTSEYFEKRFPQQVLTVHGKISEKKDILQEFKDSQTKNILVATTVIEVGVDVSEATLMIVLNAEKFGLSALHQIRGRVGRNSYTDNACVLVTLPQFVYAKRLTYLCTFQDGFSIAEKDLELRGAGDLLGNVQSGFGSEIDTLLGLNSELYSEISELVEKLDFQSLETRLPRLSRYLKQASEQVWKE